MKKTAFFGKTIALAALLGAAACSSPDVAPVDADARDQAETILRRLTLEEKVALTHGDSTMAVAANPEKGIPTRFVMHDGPHTVRADVREESFAYLRPADDYSDAATVFPAGSALAATWDTDLARRFGEALGEEARARGKDMLLGPGVNIARTPLCGRNWEYMGEDPCLAARMVVPVVRGLQSRDVAACVKHFAVNNQERDRLRLDARPDARTLREIYLPAFEAAVKQGGALAIMNAYNKLYGDYCSDSDLLNNRILKGEWAFPGLVVSDWGSIRNTVGAANGGSDLEMNAGRAIRYFKQPLIDAVREGKVPESRVDDMARRVLYVQAKLHKLDGKRRAEGSINTPAHQAVAREIAADSVVLLKNDAEILPLDAKALREIVVVGRLADTGLCRLGWSAEGKPPYETTLVEGLRAALPKAKIVYRPFPKHRVSVAPLPDACLVTENPDTTVTVGMVDRGWHWERFANDALRGAPAARGFTRAPALSEADAKGTDFSMRWRTRFRAPESGEYLFAATCDDGARVLLDGRPLIDAWGDSEAHTVTGRATLRAGTEHDLTVEYRQAQGEAVFAFGWRRPSEAGADYGELRALAKKADAVILMTGNGKGHGRALECEAGDRPDLSLLPEDDAGIAALLGVNPRTVVIVQSGSPVAMPWADRAPTILQHSFLGQESGSAVADVLLGVREPGGRLIHTWPERLADTAPFALDDHDPLVVHHKEGILVGYRWFDAKDIAPRFPFGYGLGYTSFIIGEPDAMVEGDRVTVRVPVTNAGRRAGSVVVQLYVEPPADSAVVRAPRQLAAFAKERLEPGETRSVWLSLGPRAFAWWDEALPGWRHEAGTFTLAVGQSSRDLPHRLPVTLPAWERPVPRPEAAKP